MWECVDVVPTQLGLLLKRSPPIEGEVARIKASQLHFSSIFGFEAFDYSNTILLRRSLSSVGSQPTRYHSGSPQFLMRLKWSPNPELTSRDLQVKKWPDDTYDAPKKFRVGSWSYGSGVGPPIGRRRANLVDTSTKARRWQTFLRGWSCKSWKQSRALKKEDEYRPKSR